MITRLNPSNLELGTRKTPRPPHGRATAPAPGSVTVSFICLMSQNSQRLPVAWSERCAACAPQALSSYELGRVVENDVGTHRHAHHTDIITHSQHTPNTLPRRAALGPRRRVPRQVTECRDASLRYDTGGGLRTSHGMLGRLGGGWRRRREGSTLGGLVRGR